AGAAVEVEVGDEEADDQPAEETTRREEWVAGHEVQQSRRPDGRDNADEGFDAEEELDARRLHGRPLEADLKRACRIGRVEARDDRGEALDDRLKGAL